jgi:hypothetical protein
VTASGGALFSWVERLSYLDGVAMAFSVVSTTGFEPGPQTALGTFAMFGVFFAGAVCWFGVVVAAFEIGLRRHRATANGFGVTSTVHAPWPRSIVPKGRG